MRRMDLVVLRVRLVGLQEGVQWQEIAGNRLEKALFYFNQKK